jgi:fatty acid desaturase
MSRLLLFLNSFYLGLGTFFSFYVAPTLFRVLEKEQAGRVVEKVFPAYFGIGLVIALVSLVLSFKLGRWFVLLVLINLLVLAFQEFYVLPLSHQLKLIDYQAFMRWHGISMVLNVLSLLLVFVFCLLLLKRW